MMAERTAAEAKIEELEDALTALRQEHEDAEEALQKSVAQQMEENKRLVQHFSGLQRKLKSDLVGRSVLVDICDT